MKIKIKQLSPDAVLPKYATEGSAGFDLSAAEDMVIRAGETVLVKTGLSVEIPVGFEMQVRPRSGTSLKTSLRVANSPGTIDSDYRGEVCVIMTNASYVVNGFPVINLGVQIKKGERIAQGVICPVVQAEFEVVSELSGTVRGEGGFGSTGK